VAMVCYLEATAELDFCVHFFAVLASGLVCFQLGFSSLIVFLAVKVSLSEWRFFPLSALALHSKSQPSGEKNRKQQPKHKTAKVMIPHWRQKRIHHFGLQHEREKDFCRYVSPQNKGF